MCVKGDMNGGERRQFLLVGPLKGKKSYKVADHTMKVRKP